MNRKQLFRTGLFVATPGAIEAFTQAELSECLNRHRIGDFGDISEEDRKENVYSVTRGFRVFSAYNVRGRRLWIITEADRSATTALLPEEY
jgi:hypothetical protein